MMTEQQLAAVRVRRQYRKGIEPIAIGYFRAGRGTERVGDRGRLEALILLARSPC